MPPAKVPAYDVGTPELGTLVCGWVWGAIAEKDGMNIRAEFGELLVRRHEGFNTHSVASSLHFIVAPRFVPQTPNPDCTLVNMASNRIEEPEEFEQVIGVHFRLAV